jgi:hypothetical protein
MEEKETFPNLLYEVSLYKILKVGKQSFINLDAESQKILRIESSNTSMDKEVYTSYKWLNLHLKINQLLTSTT